MYDDDNTIDQESENRFIRFAAIALVLVIAFISFSDVQTTLMVMRTGWDGSAGSILSPQEAKVFYTCCSVADVLLLSVAAFFLMKYRQKMVLFILLIFVLTQAPQGILNIHSPTDRNTKWNAITFHPIDIHMKNSYIIQFVTYTAILFLVNHFAFFRERTVVYNLGTAVAAGVLYISGLYLITRYINRKRASK